jgi:Protein of unknown function (DUF1640)
MTTPRLTFLYPTLFQLPRTWEAAPSRHALDRLRSPQRRAMGLRSHRRLQSGQAQRYGPAAEPILPSRSSKRPEQELLPALPTSDLPSDPPLPSTSADRPPPLDTVHQDPNRIDADTQPDRPQSSPASESARPTEPVESNGDSMTELAAPSDRPLDRVLQLEAPSGTRTAARSPTHLQPPPYVHHFDTYTLVNDLQKGGFSQEQSITAMKAVRSLLADNMDLAKDGIVSKSDIENVCLHLLFCWPIVTNQWRIGKLSLPCCVLRAPHRDPASPTSNDLTTT